MDIKLFKDKLFAKASENNFTDYEIYYEDSKSFSVSAYDGEISDYRNSGSSGVSFRGTFAGKVGYSYSENISEDVIDFLIKEASENAVIYEGEPEEINKIAKSMEFKEVPPVLVPETLIQYAMDMEKYAYAADKRVTNIIASTVVFSSSSTYIANSYGLDLLQDDNISVAYIGVKVDENEQTKAHYEFY